MIVFGNRYIDVTIEREKEEKRKKNCNKFEVVEELKIRRIDKEKERIIKSKKALMICGDGIPI